MAHAPRLAIESIAGQRPYQEDSVLAQNLSDGRVLIAVADGMGGHAAGEVASALALETLVSALEAGEDLDTAFVIANAEVNEKAREPGKQGMGTTLTAALVEDGEYLVANVGDSRGYLLSSKGIRQLTQDHSFVAEAMKRGQTEAEAMATPWKDALTRSIGTGEEVEVDVFGPFPLREDIALLICSDGLYKTLSDQDLEGIFLRSASPIGAAQTLVSSALESGSDDNISVVIAEYGEVPRTEGEAATDEDADDEHTDEQDAAEAVEDTLATDAHATDARVDDSAETEGDTEPDLKVMTQAVGSGVGPPMPVGVAVVAVVVVLVLVAVLLG